MIRIGMFAAAVALVAVFVPDPSARGEEKKKPGWYAKAVKKVEATFDPAEAKPGQTVTFKLVVDLNDGFHTYPTVQPDPGAENFVNMIKYPAAGNVIFVGKTIDPKDYDTKAEPLLKIKELRVVPGAATFARKVVVSPKAAAGMVEVKLDEFRLQVCDKKTCFPGIKLDVSAMLKVLDGPAVPVEKDYADEVKKALEK